MLGHADFEMELEEGERYLQSGKADLARAKFSVVLAMLNERSRVAENVGRIGGPVAGIAVAELVDALRSGLDHPLLDAVVGGLLGAVVGKAAVQFYSEAMKPLAVRAYNGLGDAYRQTGEISRARQSYAQALNLSPDDAGTLQRLASVAQAT